MRLNSNLRKVLALLLLLGSQGWMASTASALTISETPLFLTTNIPPNVIVTLDDSGSMSRAFTPDVCGNPNDICDNNPDSRLNGRFLKSSYYNPIYYNPAVVYKAPVDASGAHLTTSFNHAWVDGYAHDLPNISPDYFDLATEYRPTAGLFLHSSTKSHEFMNHYTASADLTKTVTYSYATDVHSGTMLGTNTSNNAPSYYITDYVNQDGSGGGSNPGGNLISVTVNGATLTSAGTYSGTCDNTKSPGSASQYKTNISGSTLTLCFRDTNSMYGGAVVVTHKVAGTTSVEVPVAATEPVGAYYYVFDELNTGCAGTAAAKKVDNDCYDIVLVSATSGPAVADLNGDGVINSADRDERQNFANWYSFYRTRNLATIASASLAFSDISPTTRVAWQSLNTCRASTSSLPTTACSGWDTSTTVNNAIKPFTGSHKQDFYTWLFRLNTNTSTPLRQAMQRAGAYYSTTGENSPYDNDLTTPGTVSGTSGQLSCRKNFHILMTDGIWNDSVSGVGNLDGSLPHPYSDGNSNSLADVAYKYWATDLVPLANNLLPYIVEQGTNDTETYNNPKNDPQTQQHMVNFTVGLGLTPFMASTAGGGLTYGDDDPSTPDTYTGSYLDLLTGTKSWPVTGSDLDGNVADLWHAALNSRGRFFSADAPDRLVGSFREVVDAIDDNIASAAALAANSTSLNTGALVYQATFNGKGWSGDLLAYPVGLGGVVASTPAWSAANRLPAAGARTIFTISSGSGTSFSWGSLSSAQQAALNHSASGTADSLGSARLDWLRGVRTQELSQANPTGVFRARTSVLGDIINSDPAFAYDEDFGYADMAASEASSYTSYVSSKSSRTPAVFVGGNDGMLHAFNAVTGTAGGVELFAFVPNAVYPNLSQLTDPGYAHQYYVDGSPAVGDAYLSGWQTILVGSLGGGGKSVFALNVSTVESPSASMVMWEFTDADLGLTYSKPQIARLNSGQWVAIFGNGYNSTSERAYLYVVNLSSGALIAKIAAGSATANGLSTPVLYDANGDKIMDYAYAGDLQGNLWKFDLTSLANQTTPQFVARNASGQVQPITAQPVITSHPNGGVLVEFGTGQYLEATDLMSPKFQQVQSFYAIWDHGSPITTTDRSELQQQSITDQASHTFTSNNGTPDDTSDDTTQTYAARITTRASVDWSTKKGWYMDLSEPSSTGERVVTQPIVKYGRVIFLTVVPSNDVCRAGGLSWLMELDAVTGAATTGSSFDFNNDGKFDSSDLLASGDVASGIMTSVGITKPPAWFTGSEGKDYKVMTGTTGGIQSVGNKGAPPPGPAGAGVLRRTYWMQIQ